MSIIVNQGAEEYFYFRWVDLDGTSNFGISSVKIYASSADQIFTSQTVYYNGTTFVSNPIHFDTLSDVPSGEFILFPVPDVFAGRNILLYAEPYDNTNTLIQDLPILSTEFYVQPIKDDLTIDSYSRNISTEANRAFTPSTPYPIGYVRGTNISVTGTKSVGSFTVDYVEGGASYIPGDGFLVDNGTTWSLIAPAEPEGIKTLRVKKDGSVTKFVTINFDRTAPSVSISLVNMVVGTTAGNPMLRGERVMYSPTYSDAGSGIDNATRTYSYTTPSHFVITTPPAVGASGTPTVYLRTSTTAPATANSTTQINLTVSDLAGNTATASTLVHFTTLPTYANPTGTVSNPGQSPLTLFAPTELVESPEPYGNTSVTATVNVTQSRPVCRNSGVDDTQFRLQSGTLLLTTTNVSGAGALIRSVTANVLNTNTSGRAKNIVPVVISQYYQTSTGAGFGSFDYNANKANDINIEPTLVTPSNGFNAVLSETLYDAYSVSGTTNTRGIVATQANISFIGGQAITSSASTNNSFTVRITPSPASFNSNVYRISVRGPVGLLSAADVDVAYSYNGIAPVTVPINSIFNIPSSALPLAYIDISVTMKSTATNSRVNAIYLEYIQ